MYNQKYFLIIFKITLFMFMGRSLLFPQLGKTCPPCDAEKAHYLNAKRIFTQRQADLKKAQVEMNKRVAAARRAANSYTTANLRANRICKNNPNSGNCKNAQHLARMAFFRMEKRTKQAEDAIEEYDRVLKKLKEAKEHMDLMKLKWNECKARIMPGPCLICDNGHVVSNDDDFVGVCEQCKNGEVIHKDWEEPGTCRHCVNKKLVYKCKSDEQCCWGECRIKVDLYWTVMVIENCDGEERYEFWSKECFPGAWGDLARSKGGCKGSDTRIECSGPYQPCYPGN